MITRTGISTAGQIYSLDCSSSLTETADTVTYQWFDSNGTQLTNISQLQFFPLLASHAGTYTCRTTVGGGVVLEETITVTINCKEC